jgi:hypothetical protein
MEKKKKNLGDILRAIAMPREELLSVFFLI